jgi:hypothetical protein
MNLVSDTFILVAKYLTRTELTVDKYPIDKAQVIVNGQLFNVRSDKIR